MLSDLRWELPGALTLFFPLALEISGKQWSFVRSQEGPTPSICRGPGRGPDWQAPASLSIVLGFLWKTGWEANVDPSLDPYIPEMTQEPSRKPLRQRAGNSPHFADREIEVQVGKETWQKFHSLLRTQSLRPPYPSCAHLQPSAGFGRWKMRPWKDTKLSILAPISECLPCAEH